MRTNKMRTRQGQGAGKRRPKKGRKRKKEPTDTKGWVEERRKSLFSQLGKN